MSEERATVTVGGLEVDRRWLVRRTLQRPVTDQFGAWSAIFELDDAGEVSLAELHIVANPPIPAERITTPDLTEVARYERLRHLEKAASKKVMATTGQGWFYGVDPETGEETEEARMVTALVDEATKKPPRRGHGVRIDVAFLAEVLSAWSGGETVAALAERFGVSERTVARWLKQARAGA